MTTIIPTDAREFWRALMDNASSLIADAGVLQEAQSFGRARSLTVLAQEELGKALWLYDAFQKAWSEGDETPRTVEALKQHGRNHTKKTWKRSYLATSWRPSGGLQHAPNPAPRG